MTDNDLAIEILQGIRDDLQRSNRESAERFEAARCEQDAARAESNQHFDVIDAVLREVADQLVVLNRLVSDAH